MLGHIVVVPETVHKLDGNVLAAYVLSAVGQLGIQLGVKPDGLGQRWVRVSGGELGELIGISAHQARRTLRQLVDAELLNAIVDNPEPHDRTLSYAVPKHAKSESVLGS